MERKQRRVCERETEKQRDRDRAQIKEKKIDNFSVLDNKYYLGNRHYFGKDTNKISKIEYKLTF